MLGTLITKILTKMEKEENLLSCKTGLQRLVCEIEAAGAQRCIFRKDGEERKGGRERERHREGGREGEEEAVTLRGKIPA